MKNIILKTTAVIMGVIAIASVLLHAFYKASLLYEVAFLGSTGWLLLFAYANNWFERSDS